MTSLMLFTRDLRVDDNPALYAAAETGHFHCLFVKDDRVRSSPIASERRNNFLEQCLKDLSHSLTQRGSELEILTGDWLDEVTSRAADLGAQSIHMAKDYSTYAKQRSDKLGAWCKQHDVLFVEHPGLTAVPPGDVAPAGGGEYKVFTPYWRAWLNAPKRQVMIPPPPLADAGVAPSIPTAPEGLEIGSTLGGETHAWDRLHQWLQNGVSRYQEMRDLPAVDGTSLLSPYLHLGCISPLRLVQLSEDLPGAEPFIRQVVWRDFYTQILDRRPDVSRNDYRPRGDLENYDRPLFDAWTSGTTGFPLVDAGMRQLKAEGLMHNRVRMVTASFLVKDLHQHWRLGADYFMTQLIDGDVASNYLNWQWVAGTGTDSNPHRILNPTTQATRFDKEGIYIKRWIPELSSLDPKDITNPSANIRSQVGYPSPIVDHHESVEIFKARRLATA